MSLFLAIFLALFITFRVKVSGRIGGVNFINEKKLTDWTHVYYSEADDKARIDASIPGYSQLFDVQTFPTLYLLDKDKRIIAKKLSYEQLDEILQLKLKGQ